MEENIVRKILKNEITWILMIVGFLSTFFTQVIIPISTIQIQLAQLRQDISDIKSYDGRITENANDILVLKEQIKLLLK